MILRKISRKLADDFEAIGQQFRGKNKVLPRYASRFGYPAFPVYSVFAQNTIQFFSPSMRKCRVF
jgi:hypothetical protein